MAISDFAFSPAKLVVTPGTTVTWTNNDSTTHTVTSTDGPTVDAATTGVFDSGGLAQGRTFSFTFEKAGTYYYECTIHKSMSTMHAVIEVSASASANGTAGGPSAATTAGSGSSGSSGYGY